MLIARKESGYLLMEMMIVLLIIGIIGSVAYPKFDSFIKNRETEYFLHTFQKDIIHMQQKAVTENRLYNLSIDNQRHIYEIRGNGSQKTVKHPFPKHLIFDGYSMESSIQFNQFGNISRAGTLYIHSDNATYKMVFQIGKGKFYVAKQ